MIDLSVNETQLERTAARARERGIRIPTFRQMRDPSLIPQEVKDELQQVGLWDLHPANLFRITWKNEPVPHGGGFGRVNCLELPSEFTGVPARIFALVGKWLPTGSHKVGATFGCLTPRLITGQFDPTFHKAAWPSTGNYCRGGAYVAALLACESIAILPEGMSRERFEWLSKVAGEVIATPGTESNVWEIFQKCKELEATRDNVMIFDQFSEIGNGLWHYAVTGPAMEEALMDALEPGQRVSGMVVTSGSAGTTAAADYLKERFPHIKVAVAEALQCPTLLWNGYGAHRIEGIGDKHIPWIHNLRNTDMVMGIDDELPMRLLRLTGEPAGHAFLRSRGIPAEVVEQLPLMGISSAANLISAVKMARFYELSERDAVITVFTDSQDLYGSRLEELRAERGEYSERQAELDLERCLHAVSTEYVEELGYWERRRIHNLKYFTWVEQMGKSAEDLSAQWYEWPEWWSRSRQQLGQIDELIEAFNLRVGG